MDEADTSSAVVCPLWAGGCSIHASRMLHYAGLNQRREPRRAYIQVFGLPPTPREDDRRFPWNETKVCARIEREQTAAARGEAFPKPRSADA